MSKKICVLGTGSGALAVSAGLTRKGHEVTIWDDGEYACNIRAINANERKITLTGQMTGEVQLARATESIAEAVEGQDMILLVMPSYGFKPTAEKIAPFLRPQMKFYICVGSTGGALEVAKIFHDKGVLNGVYIGEFSELPYGCFRTSPTSVRINTIVTHNEFAAFPSKYTEQLLPETREVFDNVKPLRDVLVSALSNGNIICHGPVLMLNAAGTEGNPDNHHYRDGITPSVARVMDAMDEERMAVCRALGHPVRSVIEGCVAAGYCPALLENSYLTYHSSQDFMTAPGPTSLDHRYMNEDIPYSALVVSVIGSVVGVPTPLIDAMITICGALMGKDYWHTGRTAEALGVAGMSLTDINRLLKEGYPEQDGCLS